MLQPVRVFLQRHGIEASYRHRVGPPARDIVRLARAGRFDLVVMGSHGRSGLAGAELGSVVQKVLALGRLPVLVVR